MLVEVSFFVSLTCGHFCSVT